MHGEGAEEGFEVEVVESGEPVVSEKELETETCGIVRGRSVEKLAVNAVLCPEAASAMELPEKDSQIVEVATSEEVVASWEFFGTELQEMVMGRGFRGCDGKVHAEELGLDVVVSGEGIVPEKELETFMWGGGVDKVDVGATLSQDAFVSDEELEREDSQIVKGGGMKEFETGGTYLNEIISSGEVFSNGKSLGTDFQLSEVVMGKSVKGFNGQVRIQEMEVEAVVSKGGFVSGKELESEACGITKGGRVAPLEVDAALSQEADASAMELQLEDSQIAVGGGVEDLQEGKLVSGIVEIAVTGGVVFQGKNLETDFQLSEVVMGRSTMGCNGRLEKLGVKIVVSGERSVSGKELETKACGVVVGRVVKELEVHDSWFQEAIGPEHELETEDSETIQQASVAGEQVLGVSTNSSKADACRDLTANVWHSALGTLIVAKTTEEVVVSGEAVARGEYFEAERSEVVMGWGCRSQQCTKPAKSRMGRQRLESSNNTPAAKDSGAELLAEERSKPPVESLSSNKRKLLTLLGNPDTEDNALRSGKRRRVHQDQIRPSLKPGALTQAIEALEISRLSWYDNEDAN